MSESGGAYPSTVELKDHTILMIFYEEGEGSGIGALRFEKLKNNHGAPAPSPIQTLPFAEETVTVNHRFVAIDNVCAWPNLTVLADGTILATIFNQPSHARSEGDVECWTSTDGHFWEKWGTPAVHAPGTNRMNVAEGLAGNGDLIVIASRWSLKATENPDDPPSLVAVLRPWISRSSDGGRNWEVNEQAFPVAGLGMTEFIPFGDIMPGADGSLRVLAYAQSANKVTNKVSFL